MSKRLSANFMRSEVACNCKDLPDHLQQPGMCKGKDWVHRDLTTLLEIIRNHFQTPVRINSGYRCPVYNRMLRTCKEHGVFVGVVCPKCNTRGVQRSHPNSNHMKGTEADIVVVGVDPRDVAEYVRSLSVEMVKNVGDYLTFTHVGVGGWTRKIWSK